MEMVMLIGIPASGKSSFYKERFFDTHVRISLDQLNTRNKEGRFLSLALELQQRFVLDNTSVLKRERAKYISIVKMKGYRVIGYYFDLPLSVCLERNEARAGKNKIERVGVLAKFRELEAPSLEEGFNELYVIRNDESVVNI